MAEYSPFTQATDLALGVNLSPLLFCILLKHLHNQIRGPKRSVEVILYVDDSQMYGLNRFWVQQAFTPCGSEKFRTDRKLDQDGGGKI